MSSNGIGIFILHILVILNIQISQECPLEEDVKAAFKSGEISDQSTPITLAKIKAKLRDSEIIDWESAALTDRERKELAKLFDAVEIMTTSRNRQPQSAQNVFSALRLVERVVKKQLKEGQISETLAAKFNWEKISGRHRRAETMFHLDKDTNMRIFNLDA